MTPSERKKIGAKQERQENGWEHNSGASVRGGFPFEPGQRRRAWRRGTVCESWPWKAGHPRWGGGTRGKQSPRGSGLEEWGEVRSSLQKGNPGIEEHAEGQTSRPGGGAEQAADDPGQAQRWGPEPQPVWLLLSHAEATCLGEEREVTALALRASLGSPPWDGGKGLQLFRMQCQAYATLFIVKSYGFVFNQQHEIFQCQDLVRDF